MSNAKSKQAKPKTGLARCMELASDRKSLVFLAAVLSSLAAIASFIPYIAIYFMIRSIIGVFPNLDQLDMGMVMKLWLVGAYRNRGEYPVVFSGYFQLSHGGIWNTVRAESSLCRPYYQNPTWVSLDNW